MRNLTIKREKRFVACLAKMKVYIEDASGGEKINDVPCRMLGELKNGEEKTFAIENSEAKIFVIAGKMSKSFCYEFYQLPEGESDIYLTGKNRYNPANGNAFRFDNNNTNGEVLTSRKKSTKKGIIILVIAIIIGFALGFMITYPIFSNLFSQKEAKPKEFSYDGMQIELTEEFSEMSMSMPGYTVCYESPTAAVLVARESFDLMDGLEDLSLEEYGTLGLQNNRFGGSVELQNESGLTFFEYQFTNPAIEDTYTYFSVLYKASDAFWMVQFATMEDNIEEYRPQFIEWAKTVEFQD